MTIGRQSAPPPPSNPCRTSTVPAAPDAPRADAPTLAGPRPSAPRRFRASDVALHLDMSVIGDVCVGVSLKGYQSVLAGFLHTEGGSLAALLASLGRADATALPALAHAVKGVAASLGLRQVQALAAALEADGAALGAAQCQAAAARLREQAQTAQALLQRMGFL